MRLSFYFLLILCVSFLLSCDNSKEKPASTYVKSYTSGMIDRKDPIKISFQNDLADSTGELNSYVIKTVPSVEGELKWEDKNTLVFQPKQPLEADKTYKYAIDPRYLNMTDHEVFQAEVKTIPLFLDVSLEDIRFIDKEELDLHFKIVSSDYISEKNLEEALEIDSKVDYSSIFWQHDSDGKTHQLVVKSVRSAETKEKFQISFDPAEYNGKQKANFTLQIPEKNKFDLIEYNIYNGNDQYVELFFSDNLDVTMNMNGLVKLRDSDVDLQMDIQNNRLRIFPKNRLTGSHVLKFYSGITSASGRELDEQERLINFKDFSPELRLDNENVILPEGDKLYFPFKAVGLTAVDMEIIKVSEKNILQFLQSNSLEENYNLDDVGKPILSKKVELSELESVNSSHHWSQYAIDLSSYIDVEKGAMYSIRLAFRPEYTTIPCAESLSSAKIQKEKFTHTNFESIYEQGSYYGIYGYYEGFKYDDREDPCAYAYYNKSNFVSKNVIASNFSLMAKKSPSGKLVVTVNDIQSAAPQASVDVELYDYQQHKIGDKKTPSNGVVEFDLDKEGIPYFVVAKRADNQMYLRLNDGDALSISEFNVGGIDLKEGTKAFLYTGRGVWRPGEDIHLTMMVNNEDAPESIPARLVVYDPKGREFLNKNGVEGVNGIYTSVIETSTSDLTGTYRAVYHYGGATYTKYLNVKTIKPNRLKIILEQIGSDENNTFSASIFSEWLHGAIASNLKYDMTFHAYPTKWDKESLRDYNFGNIFAPSSEKNFKSFSKKLNKDGRSNFSISTEDLRKLQSPVSLLMESRVYEPSGNFSNRNKTLNIHPFSSYVGIEVPETPYTGNGFVDEKTPQLNFVTVDKNGDKKRSVNLKVELYEAENSWWWQSYDDGTSVESVQSHNLVFEEEVKTDNVGLASIPLSESMNGYYVVKVKNQLSGHTATMRFYKFRTYSDIAESAGNTSRLPLTFKSEKILKGENINFSVYAPEKSRLLVSLEDGREVHSYEWYELKKGENKMSVPVENFRGGGVYVSTILVRPRQNLNDDLPLRRYNIQYIEIEDSDRTLKPKLDLPIETKPNSELTVKVSEEDGRKMSYTLMIVDEGVLDLTNFTTPNPHDIFSAKEGLNIKTWDNYDKIIGPYTGEEKLLAMGGDASLDYQEQTEINRFEPVSIFKGPFTLDANETETIQFNIPNYIGSVKVMLVAKHNNAYGSTDGTVKVKKELMLLSTLPRVLAPMEQFNLPITIFADNDKVRNIELTVKDLNGYASFPSGNSKSIQYSPENSTTSLPVKMGEKTGISQFVIKGIAGRYVSTDTVSINIRNPRPRESITKTILLKQGEEHQFTIENTSEKTEVQYSLGMSQFLPVDKEEISNSLISYPYSCAEQFISRSIAKLLSDKDFNSDLQSVTSHIRSYQTSMGGYAFWPNQESANPWISSYAGHMFYLLQQNAYQLSEDQLSQWIDYQRKAARVWDPALKDLGYSYRSNDIEQAYRLYTLTLHSEILISELNRLREYRNLSRDAAVLLASAYANSGRKAVAQSIVDNLNSYKIHKYNSGMSSPIRNKALGAYTLSQSDMDDKAIDYVRILNTEIQNDSYGLNTQEKAFILMLLSQLKDNGNNSSIAYEIDGGDEKSLNGKNYVSKDITTMLLNNSSEITVKNTGNKDVFVHFYSQFRRVKGQVRAESSGLELNVKYYDLNMKPINIDQLNQGTDFYAVTTLSISGNYSEIENVALSHVFPSGWEIVDMESNPFDLSGKFTSYNYQDVRDDRVNTFINLSSGKEFVNVTRLTSTYAGEFHKAGVRAEAMYQPEIYAQTSGQEIIVTTD